MSEDRELVRVGVWGKPIAQGSLEAFVPTHPKTKQPYRRKGGTGIVVNVQASNKADLNPFREKVAEAARELWSEDVIEGASLMVELHSYLKRPQADWGTGRNAHLLKDHADAAPLSKPDVDKLLRAILDALTGVVYKDDALITRSISEKHFAIPSEEGDGLRSVVIVSLRARQVGTDLPPEERERYVELVAPEADAAQLSLA